MNILLGLNNILILFFFVINMDMNLIKNEFWGRESESKLEKKENMHILFVAVKTCKM